MKTYEKKYDKWYFDTNNWYYVSIEQLKKDYNENYCDEYAETFDDFMTNALSKNGGLETVEYAYRWAKDDLDCYIASLKAYGYTLETCDRYEYEEYEIYAEKLAEAIEYMNMK